MYCPKINAVGHCIFKTLPPCYSRVLCASNQRQWIEQFVLEDARYLRLQVRHSEKVWSTEGICFSEAFWQQWSTRFLHLWSVAVFQAELFQGIQIYTVVLSIMLNSFPSLFPSVCSFVCSFVCPSDNIYPGCLVSATPLTVLYRSFWNFAVVFFMVWGYACGLDIVVRLFFSTFCELSTSVYRQWVPCERNSSYSFTPIFLKLCTCFLHSLKMCMWFGYNPYINLCHFFRFMNFVIFWPQILWKCMGSWYLVSATLHTILYRPFWNFAHVVSMVLRYACGLDIINEFCHFFHFVNIVIFWPHILWKCIDSGYLVSTTPYTISYLSLCNFANPFSMVWRCACGLDLILQLIFVTFWLF